MSSRRVERPWKISTLSRATMRWRSDRLDSAQDRHAGVARLGAELLFDAQQLVVLGQPVGTRQRAGLDLAAVGGDGEIGDSGVLGLARAMRHHGAVAGMARH